jgi:hypothetical protein
VVTWVRTETSQTVNQKLNLSSFFQVSYIKYFATATKSSTKHTFLLVS